MPVSFLSAEQRSRYGVFNAVPDIAQLGAFFHLDADDRRRAMAANGARNRLGWSLQLGTARFLNCFLDDPEDVPAAVVDYVAEQLVLQAADLKGYGEKEARWAHQEQIRTGYGYTAFAGEQWFALACWLYKRAWTTNERPIVLFDLATHRLVEAKILLPGVTTLERLIAALRERVAARQHALMATAPSPNQAAVLENLVKVEEGRRVSRLDRLRKSPTDVSSTGLVKALDRHVELRDLGAAGWDLSAVPPGKIAALALLRPRRPRPGRRRTGRRPQTRHPGGLRRDHGPPVGRRGDRSVRPGGRRPAAHLGVQSDQRADAHPQRPRHRGDRAA
ncbi:DUF4158 domain-containing protein [Nonomuraea sp. GTA35]|uniref:DUF4158 domain-containing protein n=1 Tax=Nonomuraea sp. GTA35 TaxID=1676746 RepID=UPI0035C1F6F3